jgi:O-antigen ligase
MYAAILGLTVWKPRVSLCLFILASPLLSVYHDLGSDPRVVWAFFLGIRAVMSGTKRPQNLRIVLAAVIFFAVGAIVLSLNIGRIPPDDEGTAWRFFAYFVAGTVFIFAESRFIDSKQEAIRTLVFLGLAAAVVALFGIWQGYQLYASGKYDRVGSTLINPNALASFMSICAIALISARRLVATRKWRVFVWSVVALASLTVFLSLSRAGMIAFSAGLVLLWATAGRKLTLKRAVAVAVVSCVVAVSVYTLVRTYRVQQASAQMGERQESSTDIAQSMEDFTRYEAAAFALQEWSEHPLFGIGFSTVATVNYEKTGFYATTHNTLLQLLVGTGLVGIALVAYIVKQLWRGFHKQARILFLPTVGCVAVNSMFGDFFGAIELMAAVSLVYFLCKYFAEADGFAIKA